MEVEYSDKFIKNYDKIKDFTLRNKIKKQIIKIEKNPYVGKPMRFQRKGTREVHIKPFRLVYIIEEDKYIILFLELYHKDEQ